MLHEILLALMGNSGNLIREKNGKFELDKNLEFLN